MGEEKPPGLVRVLQDMFQEQQQLGEGAWLWSSFHEVKDKGQEVGNEMNPPETA